METRAARLGLGIWTVFVVLFLWVPLTIILVYAFNSSNIQSWPIPGFTFHWFSVAWNDADARDAFWLSVKAALAATAIAMVLGTMASFALARFKFFGREAISFILILPIALPGVITGIALRSFYSFGGVPYSLWTIVIGHATFCIVVLYNNAVARMRRVSGSLDEASMDLGADAWQTFRFVTFPQLRSALLAGALLAFALSFDEVVVTIFTSGAQQTLPIWIFTNFARPRELPVVNVVALFVIVASIIPVWIAQRVAGGTGLTTERQARGAVAATIEAEP